ncbi:MAG: RNA-directed DNA polymerase, partial [Candidatus Thiodiazotropha endolucinida]|nr:RNA-directed DNA polymerase [Candidatus Thiodiazotropha taylori]MCW4265016.1 RNA-directed DNA polymerase [Candidatus Thiodiazotropha endolucinida]
NLLASTRHKSSFICHHGTFQYKRVPFGLKISSFVQQLLINNVFKELNFDILLAYVDDVLVHSQTFEQHLSHLRLVFERLRAANLTLTPDKCFFATKSVKFLGHNFSEAGVVPCQSKTDAIDSFPTPRTQKEVKRYLGMTGYYRRFIKNYSSIAYPLFKLLSKNNTSEVKQKFVWTPECEESFRTLKKALVTEPILLRYPRNDKPYVLQTDGSQIAVSYVLLQEGDDGILHPVCYGGKSLRKEQRNWPPLHIELYAILLGVREYRSYLISKPFKVITDCRSLQYLRNMALTSGKLTRWNIESMQYNLKLNLKRGPKMNCAMRFQEDSIMRLRMTMTVSLIMKKTI